MLMLAPVFPADGAQGSAFNEPLEDLDALCRVQPAHVLHNTGCWHIYKPSTQGVNDDDAFSFTTKLMIGSSDFRSSRDRSERSRRKAMTALARSCSSEGASLDQNVKSHPGHPRRARRFCQRVQRCGRLAAWTGHIESREILRRDGGRLFHGHYPLRLPIDPWCRHRHRRRHERRLRSILFT